MSGKCKVERVERQIIEHQLLVGLDDKTKVALLISKEDLDMIIAGLEMMELPESFAMANDLDQLRTEAFGKV